MPDLSSHPNVYNSCLRLLRSRGFELSLCVACDEQGQIETQTWKAIKDDRELLADNPIELLGLASLHDEARAQQRSGASWWVVPGPDIRDELLDRALEGPRG